MQTTGLLIDTVFELEIGGKRITVRKFLGEKILKSISKSDPFSYIRLIKYWNPEIGGGDRAVVEIYLFELGDLKKEIFSFKDMLGGLKCRDLKRPTIEEALKFTKKYSERERPIIFPIEPWAFKGSEFIICFPISLTGRVAVQPITRKWGMNYQFAGVKRL